jgi:hypothetical protein
LEDSLARRKEESKYAHVDAGALARLFANATEALGGSLALGNVQFRRKQSHHPGEGARVHMSLGNLECLLTRVLQF